MFAVSVRDDSSNDGMSLNRLGWHVTEHYAFAAVVSKVNLDSCLEAFL